MSSFSAAWVNNMCGYGDFSLIYDKFTNDVDYKGRTEYLYGLFKRFDKAPTLLLDLACGTGGFSEQFDNLGIEVIGVDASESMLAVAGDKARAENRNILYLCQTAAELELYGTVDGAVCCLDSINHIIDEDELLESFKKVSLFLEPERLFIFDVNTEYKHEKILGDNTFVYESEDAFCVWQNEYEREERLTTVMLDFFIENDGGYTRYSEDFCERAYSDDTLKRLLEEAGLEIVAVLGDMSQNAPSAESERNIYVTRKVK